MSGTVATIRTYRAKVVRINDVDLADPDVVRIDRRTMFGNPFRLARGASDEVRARCVDLFRKYATERLDQDTVYRQAVKDLHGKRLACWCAPKLCHGDVLAELADRLHGEDSP